MSYRIVFRLAALALAACAASTLHAAKLPDTGPATLTPVAATASCSATAITAAAKPNETYTVGILKVERYGRSGRPVILIPGLAGGPWVWRGTIDALSVDHTVYAVTLAGFDSSRAWSG